MNKGDLLILGVGTRATRHTIIDASPMVVQIQPPLIGEQYANENISRRFLEGMLNRNGARLITNGLVKAANEFFNAQDAKQRRLLTPKPELKLTINEILDILIENITNTGEHTREVKEGGG